LSSYLFILCAEVFSVLISQSVSRQLLHGVKICPRAPPITHLFFSNDNILFVRADVREANHVFEVIHACERVLGQRINLNKPEISFSQNVSTFRSNELEMLLKLKVVGDHKKYLGILVLVGKSKKQVFQFIKDIVWKK